jgi:histidine triad (HIT) family protein
VTTTSQQHSASQNAAAPDCVFCKIVAGQIPAKVVYEDDNFFAFLTISPDTTGHTLVIPKQHYRWVWDHPNIGQYFEVAKKIANAQKKAFDIDMILCKVVGEEVPHAHVHLFPRREVKGSKTDFDGNQKKIVENL